MHVYGFNVCKFWDQLKAIVFVLFQLETIPNAFLPGLLSFDAKNFASMIFSNESLIEIPTLLFIVREEKEGE